MFLTNEQVNKAEVTILSARDITRPGASFCSGEGISGRKGISRECHPLNQPHSLLPSFRLTFSLCNFYFFRSLSVW